MDALIVANKYRWGLHHTSTEPSTSLWTPTLEDCVAAGCMRVPQSKLLLPSDKVVTKELLTHVHNLFPEQLRVRPTDTLDTLIHRISRCDWLDDMGRTPYATKKRGQAARLNASSLPQPRRATFSVQVSPEFTTKMRHGDERVVQLYHYYQYKQARPMPAVLFDLGTAVWKAAYVCLSDVSRICPFTHCQVLIYYECFRARINQHRDNSNVLLFRSFVNQLKEGQTTTQHWDATVTQSGQRSRSNVVVLTLGDTPMKMLLRFPHKDNMMEDRSMYDSHPSFTFSLAAGTIRVWDFFDDIFFTHEAFFEFADDPSLLVSESGMRQAYVFRHVDVMSCFHCSLERNHALVMTREREDLMRERERMKRKRAAKARADLMRSTT